MFCRCHWASQVVLVIKKQPANAGDIRAVDLIPGLGRSPGGGYGNPLQYPCLENPMDRGAWQATVHRATKSRTWRKELSTQAQMPLKELFSWGGDFHQGGHCLPWLLRTILSCLRPHFQAKVLILESTWSDLMQVLPEFKKPWCRNSQKTWFIRGERLTEVCGQCSPHTIQQILCPDKESGLCFLFWYFHKTLYQGYISPANFFQSQSHPDLQEENLASSLKYSFEAKSVLMVGYMMASIHPPTPHIHTLV